MQAIIRTLLLTNRRDRFLPGLLVLTGVLLVVARFLGGAMLVEGREAALAFGGMAVRLAVMVGLAVMVAVQVQRMEDSRELEALLARPLSRGRLVAGLAAGFGAVALAVVLPAAALLALLLQPDGAGLALWTASLALESLLMVALTLFCILSLRSAGSSVLAALALYGAGRLASLFSDIAQAGLGDALTSPFGGVLRGGNSVLALVMPRLDLFGQSSWLIYGPDTAWGLGLLVGQTALYLALLLTAAGYDLAGRRF